MGTDKAFVPLLGQPMIAHILARVAGLGQAETIIITNTPADYAGLGVPVFTDALPGKGSLGGIYSALVHSQSPAVLVTACDMPLLNPALLAYMRDLRGEEGGPYDVIVPRVAGYPQGVHAFYSQGCREPVRERLEADRLKVIGFYDRVRVRYIDEPEYAPFDPAGRSFTNINTPEELAAVQESMAADGDE